MVVHCGVHRAHHLTGRVLAMHARHRLERDIRRIGRARVVAVDAQPMHRPPGHHLIPADHRHVVFGLAGDDAGLATDAGIELDRHRPGMAGIAVAGV